MRYKNIEDNNYEVGSIVLAKTSPTVRLQIKKYFNRIYYCEIVGDESAKQKAYFERELVAPGLQA